MDSSEFEALVSKELSKIQNLLVAKNKKYGNSALAPLRIFSQGGASEGMRVRIDDKLSRIARGIGDDEDTITDLIGYLVMLKIAQSEELREFIHEDD